MNTMIVSVVVAAANNNAIGGNNSLLWKLPNDMRFFKNLTWGMVVIMGRKTFESLGNNPLPGRMNIIISRNSGLVEQSPMLRLAGSFESALQLAQEADCKEVFVIGGGEIYEQAMPFVNRIYITRVHAEFNTADTFFKMPASEFEMVDHSFFKADDRHAMDYTFEVWERKTKGA
jgi:dihydrofolate reductase